nr:putative Ig domain-containing protein [Wenzhouxiangella sp. XN79A]
MPDFIDVWSGTPVADGWVDANLDAAPPGLLTLSDRRWWRELDDEYARDDDVLLPFVNVETNAWFNFTGTALTVLAYERDNTTIRVVIDGVEQGLFDLAPIAPFRGQPRALHFTGLAEGAHSVQVALSSSGGDVAWLDAFNVDPPDTFGHTPNVEWFDTTAQEVLPGANGSGFVSTVGIGDLDGDGTVELVAPGLNGRLYVYRGDGQDAGGGSPILWTSDLVGPAAEPALADLDGDGDAEIVVVGRDGTFAFHHDGQLFWSNPAIVSYNAGEDLGWGGPTVANLDQDPEPEIVIAAQDDALYVLDHLGDVTWSDPLPGPTPTVPVLADLTGDGVLDLIVAQGLILKVIDLQAGGTVAWTRELPDPIAILGGTRAFGAPAVADLDEDGRAEVIINWGHVIEALTDDGTLLWRYPTNRTDLYRPSPVTVADVTGDGEPNLVTASAILSGLVVSNHLLMVLDRAGSLVWEQNVADSSASASGVAAQDLTGNGAWEILWNGAVDGLLLFNGPDGERLYNEPFTGSGTVLDYPTLGDVDGDGQAEVVVAGRNGLFVFGHTGRWVDARPVWNQHNYHINNIEGDWGVPFTEENSWELHNTYRTQTPNRDPDCVLDLDGNPVPPGFADLSPAARAVLPADAPLVISGRVLPVAAGQPLLTVTLDGEPVDLFDASGSFFSAVELASGSNSFELRAADRCAEAVTTLVLEGGGDAADPWADLADASVLLEARFSATTHDRSSERLLVDVQVFNDGPSVPGPVLMTVGNDVDPAVGLLAGDGFTPAGEPYVVMVPGGEVLEAGALSAVRPLAFSNPNRRPIDFTPRLLAPINQPPYFTSIPDGRATQGQSWVYEIATADGNGDPVSLTLAAGPAGMALNGTRLEWTPASTGSFDVVIEADDGRGATARQGFVVRVEDAAFNRPPVFLSSPETQRPIGAAYVYAAEADDLDGDALSFSLQAAPAGVTVDPASGLVEWASTAPGQHSLVLVADDGRGGRATQAWTLFVGEPATTVPGPAFSSVPQTFAAVGVQYRYPWRVTTFDQSTPTVSLQQAPAGMTLDPAGRTLTWVPGGGDLGSHVIELQAIDAGGQVALQRFDLEVLPQLPNQPPYMISAPDSAARIGSPYTYAAEAVDPEFEPLTWSLPTAPAGMTIDPDTGQVAWTPGAGQAGDADVVVQAADPEGAIASQAFVVRVRVANSDPVIDTVPPTSVTFGAFYSVRMLATDADGDAPTWRLLDGPAGMTLHAGLGWLHWTTTDAVPGSYPVSLEVTDGWGGRDELNFTIDLLDDVQPPEVGVRMLRDPACRAEPVTVCVDAADDVGLSSVTLDIAGQPRALDSSRCHLWTPEDAGQFAAVAVATDPSGQTAQANETLVVADCNDEQAPVVTLISPAVGSVHDAPVPIVVDIDDNTPAVLTWDVTLRRKDGEDAVVLNSGSGPVTAGEVAVFDPTVLQAGDYEIDVVASDGAQTGGLRIPLAAGTGAKPGQVAFTMRDLVWQLGAFPLVIGRSYDSLDAGPLGRSDGNFGPGWRLALSAAVEDSAADSFGGPFLGGEAFNDETRVVVTKPNGERVGFTFTAESKGFPAAFQFDVSYEPDSGVTDTLRAIDWPDVVFSLGGGYANYLIPYNPTIYELETEEGMVYRISEAEGLLEVRDPQGGVLGVDADGWQSSWGARVDYLRDVDGRITDIVLIDEDGSTELARVSYSYDALGNLTGVVDAAGGSSSYAYDDPDFPHHVTASRDANGDPMAQMIYDDRGRMVAHCPPTGDPATLDGCVLFDFAQSGVESLFDARGFRTDRFFDDAGRLVVQHDYLDAVNFLEQRWTYDERGDEVEYRDRDGGITTRERDENGNEVRRVLPDGSEWTWAYGDCDSDWIEQCDPLGNCFTREYDASCRVLSETDPLGQVRRFEYDADGLLTRIVDAELQERSFVYNSYGLIAEEVDSTGNATLFEYNAFGQVTRATDRNGTVRELIYDADNRLVEERRPGQGTVATWTYDDLNRVTSVASLDSQLNFEYDLAGRIARVEHSAPGTPTWWLGYDYDGNGNVVRVEDSAGGITEYEYDGIDRLVSIRQSGVGVLDKRVDIEATGSGDPLVVRRYADLAGTQPGPVTTYEYDCASCPSGPSAVTHRRPDDSILLRLDFTRNALGQVTGMNGPDGLHSYAWDGAGRLIDEQHPVASGLPSGETIYDGVGNWLSRPNDPGPAALAYREGGAGHRLLADGTHVYSYTPSGQLESREHLGTGERLEFTYSPLDRLQSITAEDAMGQPISNASYVYALTGWRVRAEHDGVVRNYLHDSENPVVAIDDVGNPVWRRLHGRVLDRPFAVERAGQLRWLLTDHVGTVWMETDAQGQPLAEYGYDPFGRQVRGPAPTLDDPIRFTGRDFDLPGGLGDYRARVYDAAIGRFTSEDPLRPFHYRYAENNPLQFVDPRGESALVEYVSVVCGAIGQVISFYPLGQNIEEVLEDVAEALQGAQVAPADPFSLLPAPTSNSNKDREAGGEIAAKLLLPCGVGNAPGLAQ